MLQEFAGLQNGQLSLQDIGTCNTTKILMKYSFTKCGLIFSFIRRYCMSHFQISLMETQIRNRTSKKY